MAGQCTTYQMVDPPTRGIPDPRYFTPLVRVNGIMQDAGFDWKLNPCYLDLAAIAASLGPVLNAQDNQTLSLVGNSLSISGGNSVILPSGGAAFQVGVQPVLNTDVSIPSDQVGGDAYMLGVPSAWLQINVAGTNYVVPGYAIP